MLSIPIQVRCDDIACFVAFLWVAALRLLQSELAADVGDLRIGEVLDEASQRVRRPGRRRC